VPLHRLPVYEHRGDCLPEAERASRELLSLPMGPLLSMDVQAMIRQSIDEFLNRLYGAKE